MGDLVLYERKGKHASMFSFQEIQADAKENTSFSTAFETVEIIELGSCSEN